jgi:Tfp pilus assembly protein PilN
MVNLSARPFVNRRPVLRLSLLLWAAGLVLLAGNLWLYWDFLAGRGDLDARRREVGEQITVEEHRISALTSELASYDLGEQNEQVRYLNQRIEQRRFSWSRLFEELSDLLPRDVRLLSLTPSAGDEQSGRRTSGSARRGASAVSDGQIPLQIDAQARSDEAILELVDALFADSDFERPNLLQQTRDPGSGLIRFSLNADYRPSGTEEPEVTPLEPTPSAEAEAPGETAGEEASGGGRPTVPVALGRAASSPRELS